MFSSATYVRINGVKISNIEIIPMKDGKQVNENQADYLNIVMKKANAQTN